MSYQNFDEQSDMAMSLCHELFWTLQMVYATHNIFMFLELFNKKLRILEINKLENLF